VLGRLGVLKTGENLLGKYEYNYSAEDRAVDMPQFVREVIVHRGGSFGDIYARLVSTKSFDYECE